MQEEVNYGLSIEQVYNIKIPLFYKQQQHNQMRNQQQINQPSIEQVQRNNSSSQVNSQPSSQQLYKSQPTQLKKVPKKKIIKKQKSKQIDEQKQQKYNKYREHLLSKKCRICNSDREEGSGQTFVFCDVCDDAYHIKCANITTIQGIGHWICPQCNSQKLNMPIQFIENQCYKCHNKFTQDKQYFDVQYTINNTNKNNQDSKINKSMSNDNIMIDSNNNNIDNNKNTNVDIDIEINTNINDNTDINNTINTNINKQVKIMKVLSHINQLRKCRYCKHSFHANCYSKRNNYNKNKCSINCEKCQQKLRKQIPKGHQSFIKYLQQDIKQIKNKGLLILQNDQQYNQQQYETNQLIGLRLFDLMNDWQIICRVQASLCYALKTNKLKYCNSQLYQNYQLMNMNKSYKNFIKPLKLHANDQKIYQSYLKYTHRHYIPPLQIKQDYVRGFYVVATQYIPKQTLLCQYSGQVCTRRKNGRRHVDNDSVMTLIVTQTAQTSLDVTPIQFSNMSRFIMGIPNNCDSLQNVQTLNFCYQGRSHVIFYTIKPIQRDQPLYIDYNEGVFQEYPTQHFT